MKASEIPITHERKFKREEKVQKPFFRPATDDTKPLLQDSILTSDPIETEEAVLRLPPLPDCIKPIYRSG
ncbi:hypothetical protein PHJA_002754800 [Phtheirospermum japonicum]|uniref:Uncharacterized protein n=1 Tax=Phtheirospermum japonicum TaxID=374723 RepID=A0A830D0D2_9LAMI|nr:hypothetical protein PHJA_002754800 [Phtheirospermum japonicum]